MVSHLVSLKLMTYLLSHVTVQRQVSSQKEVSVKFWSLTKFSFLVYVSSLRVEFSSHPRGRVVKLVKDERTPVSLPSAVDRTMSL